MTEVGAIFIGSRATRPCTSSATGPLNLSKLQKTRPSRGTTMLKHRHRSIAMRSRVSPGVARGVKDPDKGVSAQLPACHTLHCVVRIPVTMAGSQPPGLTNTPNHRRSRAATPCSAAARMYQEHRADGIRPQPPPSLHIRARRRAPG